MLCQFRKITLPCPAFQLNIRGNPGCSDVPTVLRYGAPPWADILGDFKAFQLKLENISEVKTVANTLRTLIECQAHCLRIRYRTCWWSCNDVSCYVLDKISTLSKLERHQNFSSSYKPPNSKVSVWLSDVDVRQDVYCCSCQFSSCFHEFILDVMLHGSPSDKQSDVMTNSLYSSVNAKIKRSLF